MENDRHHWTRDDDIVAFYLSRFGIGRLPIGEAKIAALRSLKEGSLAMRKSNFDFLDGRHGLNHPAELSRRVFSDYKVKTEAEMRPLVLGIRGFPPNAGRNEP